MSGVFGRPVPRELQEAMQHAERLCGVLSGLEGRGGSERGRAWLIGRREEIEKVLSLVIDDWEAKRRNDGESLISVLEYLAELHGAVRELFGLEAVRECCFWDVAATESVPLEDAARQPELSPDASPFPSSDTGADPRAVDEEWLKTKA